MTKIDEEFTDLNGRKFRRWTVRAIGNGYFMSIDNLANSHPSSLGAWSFTSRNKAWDWLREAGA
jgi:hypothetical protein